MSLMGLPNELLLCIADFLQPGKDLCAFVRVNKHCYSVLINFLYTYNGGDGQSWHVKFDALTWAAKYGFLRTAQLSIARGADINARERAMEFAIQRNNTSIVKLLLDSGVFLQVHFLKDAIGDRAGDIVRLMLDRGCDFDACKYGCSTPLQVALLRNQLDRAKSLLNSTADPIVCCGPNAIYLAVLLGRDEAVKMLLDHGLDINGVYTHDDPILRESSLSWHALCAHITFAFEKHDSFSLLSVAAMMGHEAMVQVLLDYGADPKRKIPRNDSPLSYAVLHGHTAVVRLLLSHGADPNEKNARGISQLSYAVDYGHTAVVRLLLSRGADPNGKDKNGDIPLTLAAINGHSDLIKILLAYGAQPIHQKNRLYSLVTEAVKERCSSEAIKALIVHGADPNEKGDSDATPLTVAAMRGDLDMLKTLLALGADPNQEGLEDSSPLEMTTFDYHCRHWGAVKILVAHGAHAGIKLLLSLAAEEGCGLEMIETLISHGADPNEAHAHPSYESPLALAAKSGSNETVKSLLNNGAAYITGGEALLKFLLKAGVGTSASDDFNVGNDPFLLGLAYFRFIFQPAIMFGDGGDSEDDKDYEYEEYDDVEEEYEEDGDDGDDEENEEDEDDEEEDGDDDEDKEDDDSKYSFRQTHCPYQKYWINVQSNRKEACDCQKVVELLLQRGDDVNMKDECGHTLLHHVAFKPCAPTVELLLNKGADPNAKNQLGQTPLHMAARGGCYGIVRVLLDSGSADINATSKTRQTALDLVVNRRRAYQGRDSIQVVVELLERGAGLT